MQQSIQKAIFVILKSQINTLYSLFDNGRAVTLPAFYCTVYTYTPERFGDKIFHTVK